MLPDSQTCLALARAVVDAGKWPFSVGMRVTECRALTRQGEEWRGIGTVVPRSDPGHGAQTVWCDSGYLSYLSRDALPDFTDPLTAAGALSVARDVWGRPDLWIRASRRGESWAPDCVGTPDALLSISAPNELEALIAAILAAPEIK